MSKAVLAAIPIKPFGVAKRRLSDRLDGATRSRLGRAIAARTATAAADAGAQVAIVSRDPGVTAWAQANGHLTVPEEGPGGLDGAADTALARAASRQQPWAVIHADLPLVTPDVLAPIFELASSSTVLVPSHDGGTNIIAGASTTFPFAYGTSSFHRHLAARPASVVRAHPQLALDLDTTEDLERALSHPLGAWLTPLLI
ncbi:MAG: 2-phospho-L-lactate guanylyltransferase [Acidimicrobiia bacterium]|nr:2-phospho-L-lactate guanylyltransferase [Acidimicrobiia bacterium]